MTEGVIFRYWGKARKPLEADYRANHLTDQQIATQYKISTEKLRETARKNGWSKAKPGEHYASYHLLAFHSLDVAAVGWWLLNPEKPKCKRLAQILGVEPHWLRVFFTFCLALHDLGKFARAFQNLRADLSPELVKPNSSMPYSERHDSLGFCLWSDLCQRLPQTLPCRETDSHVEPIWIRHIEPWLEIVTGHHGMPPKRKLNERLKNFFEQEDEQAAMNFVEAAVDLFLQDFDFQPLLAKALKIRLKAVSWQLAGVAVLADWLGSNQDYFTYYDKAQPLKSYWYEIALKTAKEGVVALPATPETAPCQCIKEIFPFIQRPTPLQDYVVKEQLEYQPHLFILEDVTGAGKTEAALILAQRMMAQGLADGLYVALPTMATANAMYKRLGQVYRKLYSSSSNPSLILAHGGRNLSKDFQDSVVLANQPKPDSNYLTGKAEHDQELSATAYCNAWLADNRKKALLADVGVGTLDQALLAVLPARHQSLRLLGMTRKVLLVDEVHAYDSYMQKLLDALLEAHARQGGSVILLSATLPRAMRENLVKAFNKGLGQEAPELDDPAQYPLATHVPAASVEQPIATRDSVKRAVKVRRLSSKDEVIAQIGEALQDGQCVCWVRNTVKAARQAYQDLVDSGMNVEHLNLFHSRFAMIDRQEIENETLERFGDEATHEQRKGRVLIATQVVEQSLDLDFDVMITDLAPIDLIIQRAGRLRRHIRDRKGNRLRGEGTQDQRGTPVLYLFSPSPDKSVDADWLKDDHGGIQAIYRHAGQLWLTAKLLLDKGQFSMPSDARKLIEGVYSGSEKYPEALDRLSIDAEGQEASKKSMADLNGLKLNKGYTRSSGEWDEETKIPTRLSEEETVSVALAVVEHGRLHPYAKAECNAWALSTVGLPEHEWKKAQRVISNELKLYIETMKTETKALRWLEIFPLTDETESYYNANNGWQS